MWNNKFKDQFDGLEMSLMPVAGDESFKTKLEKKVGEKTYELDVSYAIGREEGKDIEKLGE